MREYTVNRIKHCVYDKGELLPNHIKANIDWKKGNVGDWVVSDDACIIQILRRGTMYRSKGKVRTIDYIGTCTGTFLVTDKTFFDTDRRKNIYSISGDKTSEEIIADREKLTPREEMFVQNLASGMDMTNAYIRAYKTDSPKYAEIRAGLLVKTERVKKAMREELKPILAKLDIDEELVLEGIRDIALGAEKDSDKLKALLELGEVLNIKDSGTKVHEISGVSFTGFGDKNLDQAIRPKLEEK
tara:strand:- start:6297 stop:7025 length:729 start_codon:yes stop_codon:yes gene_type:complete